MIINIYFIPFIQVMFVVLFLDYVAMEQAYCTDFRGTSLDRGIYCGYRRPKTSYIMNGREAGLGEFPWIARQFYYSPEKENKRVSAQCGGSIIHEWWILSAAHCCDDDLAYVRLGDYSTRTKKDCLNGYCAPPHVNVWVDHYVNHERYNPDTNDNDICLIRLKKEIKFTSYVYPVCLPIYCETQTSEFKGARFTVAGWGALDDILSTYPEILQKTEVPIVSKEECQKAWGSSGDITNAQICAGLEGRRDSCFGDSGGPLMYSAALHGPERFFLVGIVSFGPDCSTENYIHSPGVYTRVDYYLPWIKYNIDKDL